MLALELGATVEELQHRMSSREFARWMAFYSINPFGEQRRDWRAGQICSVLATLLGRRPTKPADFMFSPGSTRMDRDDMTKVLKRAEQTLRSAGLLVDKKKNVDGT